MSSTPEPDNSQDPPVGPGAIGSGVGVGSLIAYFANRLPDDHPLRPILILLVPAISVGVSSVWLYFQERRRRQLRETEARIAIEESRAKIERLISRPRTTAQQRQELLDELYKLDLEEIRSSIVRSRRLMRRRDRDEP